jgi:hypothetical protein
MSTGADIAEEVRRTIHDTDQANYRWSETELLDYVNAAGRAIVGLLPDANIIEVVGDTGADLVARQALPAGGIKFVKISTNYDDNGTTREGVVRYAEKDSLDTYEPDWEYVTLKADGANYFEHFCHDHREPKTFYLYPAPAAINKMFGLVYSANPVELEELGETLPIGNEYHEAYVTYVVYRALTKEARHTMPDAYRKELYGSFIAALGLKRQADESISPETSPPPEGD